MDTPPLALTPPRTRPALGTVAELLKPITWFPPMWAFGCGVVASGQSLDGRLWLVAAGVPCEVHVEPGMYHGADAVLPGRPTMRAFRGRLDDAVRDAIAAPRPAAATLQARAL